jgi:hypothetical protein
MPGDLLQREHVSGLARLRQVCVAQGVQPSVMLEFYTTLHIRGVATIIRRACQLVMSENGQF